jgi:hypothetical protein
MNPMRPAPSRSRLRWTLRMPRPVAARDAGAACLAGGRQWPQGGAGCTAAPARGREPPPAWNSRARRAGGMGDAPQSRAQRRGNAARHGRCSLRCAGCWTKRNPREASARQTPVKVLDDRGNELRVSVYRETTFSSKALPKSRAATKNLVLHEGMIGDISFDADAVRATLANGQRVTAKLAAAADGRMSPARTKAGIGTRVWSYAQIAFSLQRPAKAELAQRSPKTLGHSPKARLVVTMIEVRS